MITADGELIVGRYTGGLSSPGSMTRGIPRGEPRGMTALMIEPDYQWYSDQPERVWFADIETTGLVPDKDILLTCAFQNLLTDDVHYITNTDSPSDIAFALDIRDFIQDTAECWWWNGVRFDLPFINKRLIAGGENVFAKRGQMEMKDEFKQMFPYLDGHLDTAAKAFGVKYQKTPLNLPMHHRAANSLDDKEAWDYLREHNVADVRAMKEIWIAMYA